MISFHLDPQKIHHFTRMQLRMIEIRNEIEMLENPIFRRTYEDIHFKSKSNNNHVKYDQKANFYIVTKKDTFARQMEYLEAARTLVGANEIVEFIPSLKVRTKHKSKHIYQDQSNCIVPLVSGLFECVFTARLYLSAVWSTQLQMARAFEFGWTTQSCLQYGKQQN